MGNKATGFKDFERAFKLEPESPKIYFARAMADNLGYDGHFWSNGADYKAAIEDFTRVTELALENPIAYFYRGICKLSSPDYPDTYADVILYA